MPKAVGGTRRSLAAQTAAACSLSLTRSAGGASHRNTLHYTDTRGEHNHVVLSVWPALVCVCVWRGETLGGETLANPGPRVINAAPGGRSTCV